MSPASPARPARLSELDAIEAASGPTFETLRDRALCLVAMATGWRTPSLAGLRRGDILVEAAEGAAWCSLYSTEEEAEAHITDTGHAASLAAYLVRHDGLADAYDDEDRKAGHLFVKEDRSPFTPADVQAVLGAYRTDGDLAEEDRGHVRVQVARLLPQVEALLLVAATARQRALRRTLTGLINLLRTAATTEHLRNVEEQIQRRHDDYERAADMMEGVRGQSDLTFDLDLGIHLLGHALRCIRSETGVAPAMVEPSAFVEVLGTAVEQGRLPGLSRIDDAGVDARSRIRLGLVPSGGEVPAIEITVGVWRTGGGHGD